MKSKIGFNKIISRLSTRKKAVLFWLLVVNLSCSLLLGANEKGGSLIATSKSGSAIILPLKKTTVEIDVVSGIVEAKIQQEFFNDTDEVLEANYIFPLPSQAAVTQMEMIINERVIKSVVKEKQEARKTYEKAKRVGHKTSLLEQQRDNIFTTKVANFEPDEKVIISFSYIQQLDYRKGSYELTFPMVVGQRYIPYEIKTDENHLPYLVTSVTEQLNPPLIPLGKKNEHLLSLIVRISGIPLKEVRSSTHSILSQKHQDMTIITFEKGAVMPDSDFHLSIYLKEKSDPEMAIVTAQEEDFDYSLLTVFPPTKQKKGELFKHPKDVIFLIDTSGSMSGASISQAKAGLIRCMEMLEEKDHFSIVRFASEFSSFSPNLLPATSNRIAAAEKYVEFLTAGGGTEMQSALEHVLGLTVRKEALPMIIFLTDGCVGNENTLFRLLDNKLGKHRLFTFAIGSAPNEYLLRKMAEKGHGDFRFIPSHESIEAVMNDFFKTIQSPILTDINITWQPASKEISTYPETYADVFYERPLQIYIRSPKNYTGNALVKGRKDGKTVEYQYPLNTKKADAYGMITHMYAKQKINGLMYDYIIQKGNHNIKQNIIDIALKYQLITQFTSRVAVEYERKIEMLPNGELRTVDVPVNLPKGWNPAEFYATATNRYLYFAIGAGLLVLFFISTWIGKRWF